MTQTDALQYAGDRTAIEGLMARHLFALDWNDFDTFAATLTEDATSNSGIGSGPFKSNRTSGFHRGCVKTPLFC